MFNKKLVFASACLGMLIFGIVMTTLGAILPLLIERFGATKTDAGSLFTLLSLGILTGSLFFGPVVDRYGYKGLLITCTAFVLLALEGIAFASSFGFLRLAVFLIGLGGGAINGGTNALVADISTEGRGAGLSLLGVFFGIGAFGIPFLLGFLLESYSYSTLIASVGVFVFLPLVLFVTISFPAPKQAQGFPLREGFRLIREVPLLLMGLILFLQSGMEITVGGWTATFVNEEMALETSDAVFFLSLFWAGMIVARLALSAVLKKQSPALILYLFIGIALVGSLLMVFSRSTIVAAPAIFFLGAGLAASFPIILGYVGDLYPNLSGTAFSIVFVMALTGGSIMPYVTGALGETFGLRISFGIIPVSLLLFAIFFAAALGRMAARRRSSVSIQ